MPPDMPDDTGRWLTYAEFASLRGIARESAVRMAQRNHWRRRRNNRGEALVMVPIDALPADSDGRLPADKPGGLPGGKDDVPPDIAAGALAALEDAITLLREAKDSEIVTLRGVIDGLRASIARAEDRAVRAGTDRDAERSRADRAEADRTDERRRADDLRDRLTAMQEQLADAHAALQAAEAADARAGQAERDKERAEADRAEERGRADRAEAATTAGRARADALRERIDGSERDRAAAVAIADEAVKAAEALRQAEDARKARGLVARLRAAWRGE
jgi:hypothetical protein